jgi:hypothetical protein
MRAEEQGVERLTEPAGCPRLPITLCEQLDSIRVLIEVSLDRAEIAELLGWKRRRHRLVQSEAPRLLADQRAVDGARRQIEHALFSC